MLFIRIPFIAGSLISVTQFRCSSTLTIVYHPVGVTGGAVSMKVQDQVQGVTQMVEAWAHTRRVELCSGHRQSALTLKACIEPHRCQSPSVLKSHDRRSLVASESIMSARWRFCSPQQSNTNKKPWTKNNEISGILLQFYSPYKTEVSQFDW